MILTNTKQAVPFQPWEGAATFMLRAGDVIERGMMEAELAGQYRAARVLDIDLVKAMREGIEALLTDDQAEKEIVLDLIDRRQSGDNPEPLTDDEKQLLTQVEDILSEHWPAFRDLKAQMARRHEIAPIVALRRFCTGIVGKGLRDCEIEFKLGPDGAVSSDTLSMIQPLEMSAAGHRAFSMQFGWAEAGNSQRPGMSDAGQTTSTSSDAPSKAAGKSKAKSGTKTPA